MIHFVIKCNTMGYSDTDSVTNPIHCSSLFYNSVQSSLGGSKLFYGLQVDVIECIFSGGKYIQALHKRKTDKTKSVVP